jgi:hypothetical protein
MASGRQHYVELRMDPRTPPVERWSAGYKIWVGGEFLELARYDDDPAHDRMLHRHPATPTGPSDDIDRWFGNVPRVKHGRAILDDIKANYKKWLELVPDIAIEEYDEH